MVSIIIPNYNGAQYLLRCVDSVFNQKVNCQIEVIVVDNYSTDRSCEMILEKFSQVIMIKLDKNYGFSTAVNEGIKASKGEFIILLNNDTEVEKLWLYYLLQEVKNDKKIFSVCSKMVSYNERDKIDDAGDEFTILGWAYKRGDGCDVDKYSQKCEVFSSCAGAAIYRREIFQKIGYFDQRFFAYMEDVDISYRAKIHGYKNIYCPQAVVYHIGSATTGGKYNSFKIKISLRNNIYLIYKNMPIVQIIINSPFLILGLIGKLLFFLKKGYLKEAISGVIDGITTVGQINRTTFIRKNFINYISIEIDLIINTFKYLGLKLIKMIKVFS